MIKATKLPTEVCKSRVIQFLNNASKMNEILDESVYVRRKLNAFNKLHFIHAMNSQLPISSQATNLHSLLYTKYYSQRIIVGEEDYWLENDDEIKEHFSDMLKKEENYLSREAFENKYLTIIEPLKDKSLFAQYVALNDRMMKQELSTVEKTIMFDSCMEMEDYLQDKLEENGEKRDDMKLWYFVALWVVALCTID